MVCWLALGNERSEFICTPEEMLSRLDQFPDAFGQITEILRWYSSSAIRREDQRLREIEPKAMGGDKGALEELNRTLQERAERRGTSPEAELRRLLASGPPRGTARQEAKTVSITERRRKRKDAVP